MDRQWDTNQINHNNKGKTTKAFDLICRFFSLLSSYTLLSLYESAIIRQFALTMAYSQAPWIVPSGPLSCLSLFFEPAVMRASQTKLFMDPGDKNQLNKHDWDN